MLANNKAQRLAFQPCRWITLVGNEVVTVSFLRKIKK